MGHNRPRLAIGVITLASAAVLLAVHLLSLVAVFSSRRSWWPPEPADVYDGLAAHGRLLIALGTGLLAVTLVLVTVGALHL